MPLVKEMPFDQFKIEKLRIFLLEMAERGQPRPFEIFVDTLKVIPKTCDPKEFDNYEHYVDEQTEIIRILIYNTDASPRNEKYVFRLRKCRREGELGEIESLIQDRLTAQERDYKANAVRGELDDVRKKLTEAEEYIEELQKELEEVRNSKKQFTFGEIASYILEGLMRRNTHLLTKLPGGEALAGIIEQDNQERGQLNAPFEQTASFQKKQHDPAVKPEHLQYVPFIDQLVNSFGPNDLHIVMQIINKLSEEPAQLKIVAELLNIKT